MPRLPEYLKRPIIDTEKTKTVRRILKAKCLNTVCEGARCPNKSECYSANTATFLIDYPLHCLLSKIENLVH